MNPGLGLAATGPAPPYEEATTHPMHAHLDHPADVPENFQRQILMLLLWTSEDKWWSLEALVNRVGDTIGALDALGALANAGLIHRQGIFVFPTLAARHYHSLFG
jgi:hypothetical protein